MVLTVRWRKYRELFERIGARRDDRSGQARIFLKHVIDAPGQLDPLIERHGRARDIGKLFGLGPRIALKPGHQLEHLLGAQPGAAAGRNRASGRDETDSRELVVCP